MHILLTDRLTCPRCGPKLGLILLAHEVRDRRILEGELGCANCRETYPVREGFADLRPPPRGDLPAEEPSQGGGEELLELAALLGITSGPGVVLLVGKHAKHAQALTELISEVEVVAADPREKNEREQPGVSRMVMGSRMPFYSGSFRGVGLGEAPSEAELQEGVRVTAPLGRIVVFRASDAARDSLEEMGCEIVLSQDGVLVGQRKGL